MSSHKIKRTILEHLPKGTIPQVATDHQLSRARIYQLLSKEEYDHPAIVALIDIAAEQSSKRNAAKEKAEKLIA